MALKNNKGFSLIEIIIAIAVLTLLLTPIMKQFAQTLEVSRQAKEQQYVNEEVIYTLEKAQVTPESEFVAEYGTPDLTTTPSCKLYTVDGTEITDVSYNYEVYDMGTVEVGAKNTVYNKTITVDDLATKIRGYDAGSSNGYTIKYDLNEAEQQAWISQNYTITNEGSAVKYRSDGSIESIVCTPKDYVGDPNSMNLGNMQNIDVNTMVLIDGTTARFDDQADKALYAYAVDELKKLDYESWDQMINHQDGNGLYGEAGYSNTVKKLTRIYVDEGTDVKGKYYFVQVDVYYDCTVVIPYTGNDGTETTATRTHSLKYPVLANTYYMDECPDIFFEYQPYINNMSSETGIYTVQYAQDDFLLFENYVDDVKVYLYKPHEDAYNVANGVSTYSQGIYEYVTTAVLGGSEIPVNIHLTNISADCKDVQVITNLKKSNFVCDTECGTYFSDTEVPIKNVLKSYGLTKYADNLNIDDYLLNLSEDVRTDDRLKTVTVTMTPDTENRNTVSLSGAKGEK